MKTKNDPRHVRRIKLIEALYAESFSSSTPYSKDKKIIEIKKFLKKIDSQIEKAAPQFPVTKIAKIDVAILRLSIFELLHEKKEPPKVIIDEAVELAKEFGGEGSPGFVNGVLGNILKYYEHSAG